MYMHTADTSAQVTQQHTLTNSQRKTFIANIHVNAIPVAHVLASTADTLNCRPDYELETDATHTWSDEFKVCDRQDSGRQKNYDNDVDFVETWTLKDTITSEWPSEQKIAQSAVQQTGIIEMKY